jgi:hypothetical protein
MALRTTNYKNLKSEPNVKDELVKNHTELKKYLCGFFQPVLNIRMIEDVNREVWFQTGSFAFQHMWTTLRW